MVPIYSRETLAHVHQEIGQGCSLQLCVIK